MTASIPSSFNPEDLQRMLEAKADQESGAESLQQKLEYIAEAALSASSDEAQEDSAVVHKLIILMACSRFVEWHTNVSEAQHADGETRSGTCWARDAGKFQAIMDILMSVSMGPNDFMFNDN